MSDDLIMLAVGAVIRDAEGRILLVRHRPERGGYWQGKWICPGGKLEPGETLADGALREIREETHLEVRLGHILPPFETIFRKDEAIQLHVVYVDFFAELVGGQLVPDDDVAKQSGGIARRFESVGMNFTPTPSACSHSRAMVAALLRQTNRHKGVTHFEDCKKTIKKFIII